MRPALASRLRKAAQGIWDLWRMDEVTHLSRYDLAVIHLVGTLDGLADRLES